MLLMTNLTPEQRTLRARAAAHARWSKESPDKHLPKARKAFMDRFERQVDPDGTLPAAERARRAEHARRAYFADLAYRSSTVRAERRRRKAL